LEIKQSWSERSDGTQRAEPHDERIAEGGVQNGGARSRYRLDRWERRLTKSLLAFWTLVRMF